MVSLRSLLGSERIKWFQTPDKSVPVAVHARRQQVVLGPGLGFEPSIRPLHRHAQNRTQNHGLVGLQSKITCGHAQVLVTWRHPMGSSKWVKVACKPPNMRATMSNEAPMNAP